MTKDEKKRLEKAISEEAKKYITEIADDFTKRELTLKIKTILYENKIDPSRLESLKFNGVEFIIPDELD